ncbi:MAG: MFS transporter [Chloroflexota bacterium]
MSEHQTYSQSFRWPILILCALTIVVVYTVPTLMVPVLFAEIAADLDLNVVQLGVVWGSVSLSSMIIGLIGGALSDRFGAKPSIILVCVLIGIFGSLRGLTSSYGALVGSMLLYGFVAPALPPMLHKTGAFLFAERKGISTITISTGFALSLFLGSRYTATWLSPAIGGWRNVLYLFGGLAVVFAVFWTFVPKRAFAAPTAQNDAFFSAIFKAVRQVLQVREVWYIGIASLAYWAAIRGFVGYTPIYLRGLGWDAVTADNTISLFFLGSLIFAIPSTYLSERFGQRHLLLVVATGLAGLGIGLLGTGDATLIVLGSILAGALFDSYMANHQAALLDLEGISVFTGSALGLMVMFREIGGFFSPPLGSLLVEIDPGMPFYLWGAFGLIAAAVYLFMPRGSKTG